MLVVALRCVSFIKKTFCGRCCKTSKAMWDSEESLYCTVVLVDVGQMCGFGLDSPSRDLIVHAFPAEAKGVAVVMPTDHNLHARLA